MAGQETPMAISEANLMAEVGTQETVVLDNWHDLHPALLTGHPHLDAEHRMLMSSIANLRKVCLDPDHFHHCGDCHAAQRNSCEGHLVSMLGDLLAFILEHFRMEEGIMRDSLLQMVNRDVCEAHMEDHAAISSKVQEIVTALDPMNNIGLIKELDSLLTRWVTHHIGLHDILLVRWIEREDSVLRHAAQIAD